MIGLGSAEPGLSPIASSLFISLGALVVGGAGEGRVGGKRLWISWRCRTEMSGKGRGSTVQGCVLVGFTVLLCLFQIRKVKIIN